MASSHGAGDPQWGAPYAVHVNPGWRLPLTGLLCKQPPYGGIRAIDLRTGRTIWDRPLGSARRNGPFGIPSMLPFTIGTPNNGGAVITASGLVFIAATTDELIRAIDLRTGRTIWDRPFGSARRNGPWGIPSGLPFEIGTPNNGGAVVTAGGLIFISAATDDVMRAIDLKTGKTLWIDKLPAGGQAAPMTYEANGRQYVVIMAGGHHFMETPIGDELIAYALPGSPRG